ncbi:double-strand break repair protein AddB [Sphingomonas hankyongi]|uniref:Double-strand break repair protein AddB n=1 Tax=Sphingomonas hankyongi TaxID=2908209 RepID=A0ABT0S3D4_9SPHN|nr:double-strand break repair protein AddB [Sphingomonas hankyongi]MCL6730367.1 double-strand break repair protein AddB [Sphingomonas hankyongi]
MPDRAAERPAVYSIPGHRSFADSLAAGLLQRFGAEPLGLARGRILLPNNRAVRAVTDAFVRVSGTGLLLPRLIPIGDPQLDERIGGALEVIDDEPIPAAIDPLERLLTLIGLVRLGDESTAEAARLSGEVGRTLDALQIEDIDPPQLRTAVAETDDLANHWEKSLSRLQKVIEKWPVVLAQRGRIDLTERRNRLLRRLADRWRDSPPEGFTVAAGITTAAPAVAALMARVAYMPGGMVVLPALSLADVMPDEEWDVLGSEQTHPQFHLKLMLDRMGVARGEVEPWRNAGRSASSAKRGRAVANAMTAPDFSHKWEHLPAPERRLTGIRLAELPDPASEAQAIALALREALETPGRTAALVTPDRHLARRVSALLARWDIAADDSAGTPLSETPAGTLLLGIASAAAEELAPVPLMSLAKHPLVGGEGEERVRWLDVVRALDRALRGPRPAPGLAGLDAHFGEKKVTGRWEPVRRKIQLLQDLITGPVSLADFATHLVEAVESLASDRAWRGPAGRAAAELLGGLQASETARTLTIEPTDALPLLRQLLSAQSIRPPYGGHPRISIWGLLEARLQHADLIVLGGLNEGVWPALPSPDPWLPPKVRSALGMPGLEFRIGLSAHDFASALGAPQVLITRARRDGRSPTVASRFLLRLQAMTGGLAHDVRLERMTAVLDDPGMPRPVSRPAPQPPVEQRPDRISITSVDRLNADPFAFYAQAILKLRALDPVDDDHTARWKGTAVHQVFEDWLQEDDCDPAKLRGRAEQLLAGEAIHPMLRALWAPRLLEAIDWMAELERANRKAGRRPLAAEISGEASLAGITVHGRADRIDRLADGGIAIIDYKTGAPPRQKAVDAGFALQLGLLGLIARAGGFEGVSGEPEAFEYWSLTRHKGRFGKLMRADEKTGADEFLARSYFAFARAAQRWLTGTEPFTAKLNPAYAPYGDYDQLMRLEEWYGRG